ncbi:MAG: hypothetical protein SFV52_13320 [Saprospiraceae bacterium]|nr:hypothetical protein [Saprospiraceae bacterium]
MEDTNNYHNKLKFEHALINRRLTWLLTSQSILFAALAFVLGKDMVYDPTTSGLDKSDFFEILACLGLSISLLIWIGVVMGIVAKCTVWYDERMKPLKVDAKRPWMLPLLLKDAWSQNRKKDELPLGVRTYITLIALLPDFFMPLAFAWAWWQIMSA